MLEIFKTSKTNKTNRTNMIPDLVRSYGLKGPTVLKKTTETQRKMIADFVVVPFVSFVLFVSLSLNQKTPPPLHDFCSIFC